MGESDKLPWTLFWDMSSGGGQKVAYKMIAINSPLVQALEEFQRIFDRDPLNITCDTCGEDYAIYRYNTEDEVREHVAQYSGGSYVIYRNGEVIDSAGKKEMN